MGRRSWLIMSILALLGISSAGCQNKLHDENMELYRQNRELQADNTRLKQELGQRPDPGALTQMQQQLAERDARIVDLQNQLRQPPPGQAPDNAFSGIEVTRDERAGTLTV